MSTDTQDGVYAALRAVQAAVPPLPKDKQNPHFRSSYTSLDSIVERVGPLLQEHGLVWTTLPSGTHDQPMLAYRLAHAPSGEVIEGAMPLLLDKSNAQGLGSALTYARRYSLCSVLNLVADEDDDGTRATNRTPVPPQIIGEDVKGDIVEALKALTGAGPDDKPAMVNLWQRIRGDHERPTVEVARVVLAIDAQRAAFADRNVEAVQETFDAAEVKP